MTTIKATTTRTKYTLSSSSSSPSSSLPWRRNANNLQSQKRFILFIVFLLPFALHSNVIRWNTTSNNDVIGSKTTTKKTTPTTQNNINNVYTTTNIDDCKLMPLKNYNFTTTATTTTTIENSNNDNNHRTQRKKLWVASYPGSGAELFRELISSVTNYSTIDGSLKKKCQNSDTNVITCKTHWPTLNTRPFQNPFKVFNNNNKNNKNRNANNKNNNAKIYELWKMTTNKIKNINNNNNKNQQKKQELKSISQIYSNQIILLIRNPRYAIPSWYNQIWEIRTNNTFHSSQAPEKSWLKFSRKKNYGGKYTSLLVIHRIYKWKEMITYWLDNNNHNNYYDNNNMFDHNNNNNKYSYYNVGLIVPYENLINNTSGPNLLLHTYNLLQQNTNFLNTNNTNSNNVITTNTQKISCAWYTVVQEKQKMKRTNHTYIPTFTTEHQTIMLQIIDELINDQLIIKKENENQNIIINNNNRGSSISVSSNRSRYYPELVEILKYYRNDIQYNMPIED